MRYLYCLLFVLCCLNVPLFFGSPALAADITADIRVMQVTHAVPVWSTDPLRVIFSPDEKECRKLYGNEWRGRCFTALGMGDAPATGVVLRGENVPKGQWRWESYTMLAFTPESPWQANTSFSVDMSKLSLPPRVKLDKRTLTGRTLPLAGQSDKGEVWIDPSVSGARALSFALYFTAPVDKSLEKQLQVTSDAPSLGLGKMQVIWGQDLTSCLVKIPITALPDTGAIARLQVTGVRPLSIKGYASNSGEATRRASSWSDTATVGNGNLIQTVSIPAKKTLFRISTAAMTLERTESLALEYRLALKTSLRVPTADMLKALKVVELPTLQNPEAAVPYRWTAAPAITQADLDKARPLKVELVKDPGESGEPVLLRVPATPGSYVYCLLPAEFGPAGYPLNSPWTAVFQAMPPESSVHFLQPGNVLTLSPDGDNRLDIVSTGVDAVQWRASRLGSDRLNLLQIATPSHDRFRPYDNMDIASTAVEGRIPLAHVQQGQLSPRFSTLALSELMQGGTGFMYVELTGLRDGKEVASTSRLVLATNLGMVSKVLPDGGRQVFVCSFSTGQPVKDAVVRILGANGQPVAEASTDAAGQAKLPAVRGLTREKEAVALVAISSADKKVGAREDLAWMSLDDADRRVDYSRFPTQGQISSPDNINVYVFGQRGIFRPGETLRFGLVIRRGNWQPLPPDMPLVATLTDPAGRVAMQRTLTVAEGLGELNWPSPQSAPTGRYRLDISSPVSGASGNAANGYDVLGSGAVRVEEFQPDTLAIRALLTPPTKKGQKDQTSKVDTASQNTPTVPKGWLVTPEGDASASLTVYLRNFYGLPAEGRKIRAELSVRPAALRFTGFEDFTFPDIMPLGSVGESATATRLPDSLTNAKGQSQVALPLSAYQSRTMQCRVLVEGFEPDGGRAVTTESNFLVSPLPIMLGYRPAGAVGSIGYVPQGTKGGLDFVALGSDLRPADPGALRLSVAERRYVTVLATDSQGKYVYEESPVDKEISGTSAKVDPATGAFSWTMPTAKAGEFLLTVRDGANRVMARIPFTVAGNDDVRSALAPQATALPSTQLRLRLDKTDYAAGDTVNILMASPYEGVGLITLERDTVASHVWFKAPAGHSVHTLTIPKDFEGRGYINVTMGRAISSPEIFMQPHSFAVVPLTVNAAGRDMGLALSAPQEVLPGTSLSARLTSRHAGKALIFAVDEGVLQLTNFTTPEPLRYLLLDRALEVETDQFFDLLMPVHAQMGKRLPAFGGDMASSGGRFQNPFKRRSEPPLAWWSGLVDVNPQGTEVSIPIPAYSNGQIRLMAVAVSASTVGSIQSSTVARAPLVITPQLPLMAAPKDSFEGGINLHNTTTKPLTVTLQVEHTGLIVESGVKGKNGKQNLQALPEKVEIAPQKEFFVPLHCVAGDMPSEASLTIIAHAQAAGEEGQTFRRTATLSIRPAVLPQQELRTGFAPLLAGGTLPTDALTRSLYPFKASSSASVSAAPLPPLRVLLQALQVYPYTCVEQSISRAFPLVLLQRRAGMAAVLTPSFIDGKPRAEVHASVMEQALNAIRGGFKRYDGMAPWPDAVETSTFLTAYAGDYLLSLKEAGLTLPGDLSTAYFETLQGRMDRAPESLAMARAQAYGLWVLTRHGLITTQWLDTLREQLDDRWPQWNKDVTASLMAGSYALMNMHGPAQELINAGGEGTLLEVDDAQPMNALAARALHVAVLARHFPARLEGSAGTLATRLLEGVNSFGGSTLESAIGARALLELAVPVASAGAVAPAEAGKATTQDTVDPFAGAELVCTAYQEGFSPVSMGDAKASNTTSSDAGKDVVRGAGVEGKSTVQAGQKALPTLLALSAPGCTQFSVNIPISTPVYWELSSDGYDRKPPTTAVSNGMEVQRVYKLADGTPLGSMGVNAPTETGAANVTDAAVAQGTVLRVELTARAFGAASKNSTPVVLADLLPGGFEFVLSHPDDALPTTESSVYTRLDRREDRVLAYTSVGSEAKTFVYHVRAVNRGSYTLPAAYGEGLYDRTVNSHTAAGVIKVQ